MSSNLLLYGYKPVVVPSANAPTARETELLNMLRGEMDKWLARSGERTMDRIQRVESDLFFARLCRGNHVRVPENRRVTKRQVGDCFLCVRGEDKLACAEKRKAAVDLFRAMLEEEHLYGQADLNESAKT